MTLQEEAQAYRDKADKLLHDSKLVEVLSKHGNVDIEGSCAANLMMSGDIDLRVVKENPFSTEETFEVFRDLFFSTNPFFRSYYVKSDWADPRLGNEYPHGHYLGIRTKVDDEVWKMDIWLLSQDEMLKQQDKTIPNITKVPLTDEQRNKILEFKKYRKEHKVNVSGQQIYEAVLVKGLQDPKELLN